MKGDLRKNEILDISKKFFSRQGYYETHVEEIITAARIGKGTFYRYFKNKDDLFISLLIRFLDDWEKAVFIDPGEIRAETLQQIFLAVVQRSFAFFRENEELCNIYLRIGPGLGKNFEPFVERFENRMLGYITRYLEEGIRLSHVRPDLNVTLVSNMLAGSFLRVVYYYFVMNKGQPVDIDRLAEDFYTAMMQGIMADNR